MRVEMHRSFVVADIPGLIAGASQGAGLGIQFLKHLSRTQVLLHLVDMTPMDGSDPVETVHNVIDELRHFSADLVAKERWLVFNKIDLLPPDEIEDRCQWIVKQLRWKGPVYKISAMKHEGTQKLCGDLMNFLEQHRPTR